MLKRRIITVVILLVSIGLGYFVYKSEWKLSHANLAKSGFMSNKQFRLGLDLSGGTELVYKADISQIPSKDVAGAMQSLKEVIERQANPSGTREISVRTEGGNFTNGQEERLTVDIPGITDSAAAVALIGQTPSLDFRTERNKADPIPVTVGADGKVDLGNISQYVPSLLTGRYLKRGGAEVIFDPTTGRPTVSISWNDEGSKLFAEITKANVGKTLAIYLNGELISAPRVNEEITGGSAVISGNFNTTEARDLARRLNFGALPVPIELLSTSTIGATLGQEAVAAGVQAGIIGFILIALFMIIWYRLPGLIAVVNLAIYALIMFVIFKIWPITLTSAGIAGFVISLGIAVDANILVFERMKEEVRSGRLIHDALVAGFDRAWSSIRDSNFSSMITALILYMVGTPLIKGFASTFFLGTLVSLIVAYTISKTFFKSLPTGKEGKVAQFLFGSGGYNATSNTVKLEK